MLTNKLVGHLAALTVVCSVLSFFAANPVAADVVAYYRFEEGTAGSPAGNIIDSVDGSVDGVALGGSPIYRADVPLATIPQTGQANHTALQFSGTQRLTFISPFILHNAYADATLEFFIKYPLQGDYVNDPAVFWTRLDATDTNRFSIVIEYGDMAVRYREPGGSAHYVLANTPLLPLDQWHHVAVTRTVLSSTEHQYRLYADGQLVQTAMAPNPSLPTGPGWTINGRQQYGYFNGLIDEVRFTDRALSPSEFLNVPEPATLSLLVLGGLALSRRRRKQPARRA